MWSDSLPAGALHVAPFDRVRKPIDTAASLVEWGSGRRRARHTRPRRRDHHAAAGTRRRCLRSAARDLVARRAAGASGRFGGRLSPPRLIAGLDPDSAPPPPTVSP